MRFVLSLLLLVPTAAAATSPIADVLCEPSARMSERLSRQQGASLTSTGLRDPEQVMEVWTAENGAWTMVIAYSTGTSCIVAMGEHWASVPPRDPA
ncbi:hypothetical protein [Salipiger sp.]|uniref:hypothetical protein n=1 Tax=Salipiger sp. TaxID=2078585 RepID=UPI003A97B1D6